MLAVQPDVLLLDEPTNALDADAKARLSSILHALPQAMILASHEQEFVRDLATRCVRLGNRKLLDDAWSAPSSARDAVDPRGPGARKDTISPPWAVLTTLVGGEDILQTCVGSRLATERNRLP